MNERANYSVYVGVDIAAKSVTTAVLRAGDAIESPFTLEQTAAGFESLQQHLQVTAASAEQTLVVMEATGSYWIPLAVFLHQAGYAVSVINPAQAHHFAKALLKRAKSDAIDAQTLAQLAQALKPARWTPPPSIYHELQQRLMERDTLLTMRQQVQNQLLALAASQTLVPAVKQRKLDLLETFSEQVVIIDREIRSLTEQESAWKASLDIRLSITGIGLITAAWLVVGTLNFSTCAHPEALSAFVGLAPMIRQSGSSLRGPARLGHAGHARLRTAL